ncbi:alpha/beta hydrolase family protein [Emydomyces testavorans]|uniref:Alpha/beta hydrolase family protein n=1 Tax=Emydomyces testavorans TaxID=2070801 RepID=A0AAF0DM60_9EURO|nr:alpha/beta hydrolase family protein [Emydomyces testavorans]
MGLRVVVPDCLGYGRTEAPEFTTESARLYGFKQCAADMKELARQLGTSKIILGGHDWFVSLRAWLKPTFWPMLPSSIVSSSLIVSLQLRGGVIVYRIALHYPEFITHIFSVCTPYSPPQREFVPLDELVATRLPFFGYQLQFMSGELEKAIQTKRDIRQFLIALYEGRTSKGEFGCDVRKGVLLDKLPALQPSRLLTEEVCSRCVWSSCGSNQVLNGCFIRNWIIMLKNTPKAESTVHVSAVISFCIPDLLSMNMDFDNCHLVNWYRTREQNYKDELELIGREIDIPVLFIGATKDPALRPELSKGMEKYIPKLTRAEVDGTHWVLWQKPEDCNKIIERWIEEVVFGGQSRM